MTKRVSCVYVPPTRSFYEELIKPAHNGQNYGKLPYTFHLRSVFKAWSSMFEPQVDFHTTTKEVIDEEIEWCDNAEFACLGHDYLEDCECASVDTLRLHGCPEPAIKAIVLVTKTKEVSYKQYLRNIVEDQLAFEVKVADTYSNMTCSIKGVDFKRVQKYTNQLNLLYKYREAFLSKRNYL